MQRFWATRAPHVEGDLNSYAEAFLGILSQSDPACERLCEDRSTTSQLREWFPVQSLEAFPYLPKSASGQVQHSGVAPREPTRIVQHLQHEGDAAAIEYSRDSRIAPHPVRRALVE